MSESASAIRSSESGNLPRGVLIGAAALVAFTLLATSLGRFSGIGASHMPPAKAVLTLALRFADEADGGVAVRAASDGAVIYTVAPGVGGFIRGTLRGLVRDRKLAGVGDETPFTLTRWSDGTLSLADAATGRVINLDAFGPTNSGAFAQFFAIGDAAK